MIILAVVWFLGLCQVRAFSPVSSLEDCPKISPDNNVKLDKVAGTWRLAYLYIDDVNDLEEDNSCGVAEIMQVNETKMGILLYIDNRKDEVTIDRYTKEFEVTIKSPGEWFLHTSFKYLEYIHVTVIGFFGDHLILTFCATPFVPGNSDGEKPSEYDSFSNTVEKERVNEIFKTPGYERLLKDLGEEKAEQNRPAGREGETFFRGKRYAVSRTGDPDQESNYESIFNKRLNKIPKKHLWTAILVRNNKVSTLEYIENASYLMKFGFDISKGQLVSFGSCTLNK